MVVVEVVVAVVIVLVVIVVGVVALVVVVVMAVAVAGAAPTHSRHPRTIDKTGGSTHVVVVSMTSTSLWLVHIPFNDMTLRRPRSIQQ